MFWWDRDRDGDGDGDGDNDNDGNDSSKLGGGVSEMVKLGCD